MLIAANETGYGNLVRLVSRSYLEHGPGDPVHVSLAWVAELADGLICLSGGPRGADRRGDQDGSPATRRKPPC